MKKLFAVIILLCLICVQAVTPCFAFEELSKGSKGDAVVELQNRLNELGYDIGKADGDFGGKTEKAIIQFQNDNYIDATGFVNEQTYIALFAQNQASDSDDIQIDSSNDSYSNNAIDYYGTINREDIVDLWQAGGNGICALTKDGQVWLVLGFKSGESAKEQVATNVEKVIGKNKDVLIYKDGSAHFAHHSFSINRDYELGEEWNNLSLVAIGSYHAIGLKADGSWVSAGEYNNGERDVEEWTDIIAIDVGDNYTVGLKSDGTVVATGLNDKGQCDVSDWSSITQIIVCDSITYGIKADGTVVATGRNDEGQCNVSEWSSIIQINAAPHDNTNYLSALRNDGTVIVSFAYDYSQDNVSNWKDISLIGGDGHCLYGITKDGRILTTSRAYKYDDNYRKIPDDYRCENVKRYEFNSNYIIIIHDDNTIDYFGEENANWQTLIEYFNNGISIPSMSYYNRFLENAKSSLEKDGYDSKELVDLFTKGINGTLTYAEAKRLEEIYLYLKNY